VLVARLDDRVECSRRPFFVSKLFDSRSLFRNSRTGCDSNRVVKEWRLLTRDSESSKRLKAGRNSFRRQSETNSAASPHNQPLRIAARSATR